MASMQKQQFEDTRSITRKLTPYPLQPIQRDSCINYLKEVAHSLSSDTRDIIYNWTRGYPLAMTVMTEAVLNEDLDLQNSAHQQSLIQRIMNEVMNNNLLKGVESEEEQTRLRTLLALFSLPRRFNLILMQDLVERFAPQYALKSSLAYMTLPAEINKVTSVL